MVNFEKVTGSGADAWQLGYNQRCQEGITNTNESTMITKGDLYEVHYQVRDYDGTVMHKERWLALVVATDEESIHVLHDRGNEIYRRRDVELEIEAGMWHLVSRGHQTLSKTSLTAA